MGELLFLWVPHGRLLRDRLVYSGPTDPAFATTQPAAVPAAERGDLVATSGKDWGWSSTGTCACLRRELSGEPDAGNLHLRFDEGRVGRAVTRRPLSYSTGSVSFCKRWAAIRAVRVSKRFRVGLGPSFGQKVLGVVMSQSRPRRRAYTRSDDPCRPQRARARITRSARLSRSAAGPGALRIRWRRRQARSRPGGLPAQHRRGRRDLVKLAREFDVPFVGAAPAQDYPAARFRAKAA